VDLNIDRARNKDHKTAQLCELEMDLALCFIDVSQRSKVLQRRLSLQNYEWQVDVLSFHMALVRKSLTYQRAKRKRCKAPFVN
jgi:hypothetical protein